jgi:hypothetical protein
MPPAQHHRAKRYLQNTTVVRDYLLLVVGWLRFPRFVPLFIRAALRNALFIPAFVRGIVHRSPMSFLTGVYTAFNRTMLERIRRSEPVYRPQRTAEGCRRVPAPVAAQPASGDVCANQPERTAA